MKKLLLVFTVAAFLTACNSSTSNTDATTNDSSAVTPATSDSASMSTPAMSDSTAAMDSTSKMSADSTKK